MQEMYCINGISGRGDPPRVAGNFSGPAVVLGSSRCVWDDLAQVSIGYEYVAVNWAGAFARVPISHWASMHPEALPYMLAVYRWYYSKPGHVWTHAPVLHPDAEFAWNIAHCSMNAGSSSLFATMVAVGLGYDPIILAGCPLDGTGDFADPPWVRGWDFTKYRKGWETNVNTLKGKVTSLSGWTREFLGSPTCLQK